VDSSSAEPSSQRTDGCAVRVEFVPGVLDLPCGLPVVLALQPVAGFATERALGVGDVPAQPVLLDGERRLFPPVAGVVVGRRRAECGGR
jgi:hypothetical protein